jgi:hypothetical protein
MAHHDELTARWMAYETDPTVALTYPSMTDARSPLLAAFLREQSQAQWLRPASSTTRMTPAEFLAYRDAVRRATHAFDDAERDARRRAGEKPPRASDAASEMWSQVAQDLADNAQRAVSDSVRAMGRAARERLERSRSSRASTAGSSTDGSATPTPPPRPTADGEPVWPVPGRDRRTPPQ